MKILDKLKATVLKCDLFWSSDYFRYRSETQYRTLTGGFCSFLIIILFVTVFSSSIFGTFNKSTLVWQYGLTQQTSNEFTITTNTDTDTPAKFMFAIGVNGLDLTSNSRYFDFALSQQISVNGQVSQVSYPLTPCSRENWLGAGKTILEIYDRMNFSSYLCPPINQQFSITGMSTSQTYKYLKISVIQCNNATSPTNTSCLPTSALETYLLTHSNFHFNMYFVNTLINPSSPSEISYYLEDRNFVPFNLNYGGQVNIFVSKYTIVTDEEILPFNSVRTSQGGVVNNVGQYIASRKFGALFANINFRKSSLSLNIERQYTKLDTTLSYIGGLFGFIIIFFVFMKIYTEYCYEIEMGDSLYHYDKQDPLDSNKFNFFTFIGYVFYELIKALGCNLDWNIMKKYGECREEIQKQFDICFLMKRIIFLQRSLRILFEDHQFKGLHMHEKLTLKEAQEIRSFYKLRDKLQSICVDEIPDTEQMERQTKKSSDNSGIMNATENILENNEELHEDQYNFNEGYKKTNFPKRNKSSKSEFQMSERNKSELMNDSEAVIKPLASGRSKPRQSKKNDSTPNNSTIKTRLKLLHKESQSGNRISKKIYEGFDMDFIKNILIKIEEEKDEQKLSEKNEIIVNENQDEFEIRISKRIMVKPKTQSKIIKETDKNEENFNKSQGQEQIPNFQIKSCNSPRQSNNNKITNEFQYIQ